MKRRRSIIKFFSFFLLSLTLVNPALAFGNMTGGGINIPNSGWSCYQFNSSDYWNTNRFAITSLESTANDECTLAGVTNSDSQLFTFSRGLMSFDLTSLPQNIEIIEATLFINSAGGYDELGAGPIHFVIMNGDGCSGQAGGCNGYFIGNYLSTDIAATLPITGPGGAELSVSFNDIGRHWIEIARDNNNGGGSGYNEIIIGALTEMDLNGIEPVWTSEKTSSFTIGSGGPRLYITYMTRGALSGGLNYLQVGSLIGFVFVMLGTLDLLRRLFKPNDDR